MLSVHAGELAGEENLSIRLDRDAVHRIIVKSLSADTGAGIERGGGFHRAIRVEPGDVVASLAIESRKRSSENDLPVGLHGCGRDPGVRASPGIEGGRGFNGAIRQKTVNPDSRLSIHAGKITGKDDPSIRLHGSGIDGPRHGRSECRIEAARQLSLQGVRGDGQRSQREHRGCCQTTK